MSTTYYTRMKNSLQLEIGKMSNEVPPVALFECNLIRRKQRRISTLGQRLTRMRVAPLDVLEEEDGEPQVHCRK